MDIELIIEALKTLKTQRKEVLDRRATGRASETIIREVFESEYRSFFQLLNELKENEIIKQSGTLRSEIE